MRRTSKANRQKKDYSYLCRLISYSVIFLLLFFNLVIASFNFYQQAEIKKILQTDFVSNNSTNATNSSEEIIEASPAATSHLPESEVKNLKEGLVYGSFGDGFTSLAWINRDQTDLTFDAVATAFYFPPKISYQKIKDCSTDSECPIETEKPACLNKQCLMVKDNKLFLNNKSINWPSTEFSGKARITVSVLEKKWLVGAIVGEAQDEKIVVYSFDGKNFSSVLGVDQIVKPNYPNKSGFLSFGGVDNDFLILYLGYDGLAYHFKNGKPENISEYFGIRVADNGFKAKILRVADSSEVFWYITSDTEWKQKFIKLWQNETDSIEGLADFSNQFFKDWMPNKISLNYLGNNGEGRVFKIFMDYGPDYPRAQWSFVDNGFDNSSDKKVSSGNLISASTHAINFTKPVSIGLNLGFGDKKIPEDWGKYATFNFSNNGVDWLKANYGEEIIFADQKGTSLYWRANLKKSGNKEYSPFFYNFNNLEYYFRVS